MLRVLMLGWELPPFITGGLGTACHGLTHALSRLPIEVLFVLPQPLASDPPAAANASASQPGTVHYRTVPASLPDPYGSSSRSADSMTNRTATSAVAAPQQTRLAAGLRVLGTGAVGGYSDSLMDDIDQFATRCVELTAAEPFDVIHAHDWMTFPAAMRLAHATGKPWVAHVHATEFDRTGEHVNQAIYDIERAGLHSAQRVIAVSCRTEAKLTEHYAVSSDKIQVIHNGIEPGEASSCEVARDGGMPIVLFLGRLTHQKGPGYFVDAAERVLARTGAVKFVIAGWGDLGPELVEYVAARGLSDRILFTGFLHGQQVRRAFQSASIYVMPSVSEPFGLTALEAAQGGAAVIVSRTSGVCEVMGDAAWTVDYWDTSRMAECMLALLRNPAQAETLKRAGQARSRTLTWDKPAAQCQRLYYTAIAEQTPA